MTMGFDGSRITRPLILGDRSMVGQLALNQSIGVRLPVSQPRFFRHCRKRSARPIVVGCRYGSSDLWDDTKANSTRDPQLLERRLRCSPNRSRDYCKRLRGSCAPRSERSATRSPSQSCSQCRIEKKVVGFLPITPGTSSLTVRSMKNTNRSSRRSFSR